MEANKRFDRWVGLAMLLSMIVGLLSLVGAAISLFASEYTGMGLCLVAAALAFGGLSIALLPR